jgi:putative nucleotidyltransferase with HDIG domain
MGLFKKTSPRRSLLRKSIIGERTLYISRLADTDVITSILLWLLFVVLASAVVSFELIQRTRFGDLMPLTAMVLLISVAAGFYIYHYQKRLIKNHARASALVGLFVLLLFAARFAAMVNDDQTFWATGTAVTAAVILAIAYDQRFAIGMSIFYCLFACFAAGRITVTAQSVPRYEPANISLFLTMASGAVTCCFSLDEIRTRIKLLQVGVLAAAVVFITASALSFLTQQATGVQPFDFAQGSPVDIFRNAGYHAGITLVVAVLIQGLLPLIEKAFRLATSMTLLDYSDANQSLLKRLAMEAPGTFSHSLLIGSIAEAAAEAIRRNGLLCRVGAYYHDIGKINKPGYFIENQMGATSLHKELSPTMSQLIIVGHVKDGIEMAKEYGLPSVLRQFIETHHGTTLVEPFYNEAKRQHAAPGSDGPAGKQKKQACPERSRRTPPAESEFRYPGPKPKTKEAAIVMLADTVEGAVRSLPEATPTKIEAVVHNMAMKRLQDGQFDECDLSLRELSQIEAGMSKALTAHYHGRIAYPKPPDETEDREFQPVQTEHKTISK